MCLAYPESTCARMNESDVFDSLDGIDWSSLSHSYGPASDIPTILSKLASSNQEDVEAAYNSLYMTIHHQGSRYSASAAAVPFLSRLVARNDTLDRPRIIRLLMHLAIGDPARYSFDFDIENWREKVHQMQTPGYSEMIIQERLAWIARAENDQQRRTRERLLIIEPTPEEIIKGNVDELCTYDAVKKEIPSLLRLTKDAPAHVRCEAIYASAWFPELLDAIYKTLLESLSSDEDFIVRSTAIMALGQLCKAGTAIPQAIETVRGLLITMLAEDNNSLVQWSTAAALTLLGTVSHEQMNIILSPLRGGTMQSEDSVRNRPPFLFLNPDLSSLAATTLSRLDSVDAKIVDELRAALPSLSGDSVLVVTKALLEILFQKSETIHKSKEELSAPQVEFLKVLCDLDDFYWHYANFKMLLRPFGLPSRLQDLQLLVNVP